MKKGKIGTLLFTIFTIFSLFTVFTASVAWFAAETINNMDFDGKTKSAYYAKGDGTAGNPYVITKIRHLNNLAWLNYLGEYDTPGVHFRLDNDIVCGTAENPFRMLPIGTEEHPFLGVFDGGGHTISNILITNKNDFTNKPSTINDYTSSKASIIGFFGVVGDLDEDVTYSSSTNTITNLKLDNITVHSETENTLIGLAAGFVNADISDITVGKSMVDVKGCKPIKSITNNLSDYSLVGYSSSSSTVSDFTKKISENYYKKIEGGSIGGFDSSVDFKNDFITWFYNLHKNKGYDKGTKNSDIGYLVSSEQSSSYTRQYNALSGGNYELYHSLPLRSQLSNPNAAFTITLNAMNPYMNYSFSFSNKTNAQGKKKGTYTEFLASSTYSQDFTWTVSGSGTNKRYAVTFATKPTHFSVSTFDLLSKNSAETSYKPLKTGSADQSSNQVFTPLPNFTWTYCDAHVYQLTDGNYLPLLYNDNHTAANPDTNTGYITGVKFTNTSFASSPRIASYGVNHLSGSITNNSITKVKTYYDGAWVDIGETKDASGKVTAITQTKLDRYINARNKVAGSIENQDSICGIHFDITTTAGNTYSDGVKKGAVSGASDAAMDVNALLKSNNGSSQHLYMPKGTIDFQLEMPGYIAFFAGMYNASVSYLNFFSLHHMDRSTGNPYTLKEIKKIYEAEDHTSQNPSYFYEYADGTYSKVRTQAEQGKTAIFDASVTLWPVRSKDNTLYYFQIPVNAGEYVMGAANDPNTTNTYQGAYMMYLDLGANGNNMGDTTMNAHYVETITSSDSFPAGIDFNITSLSEEVGGNTICIAITYSDLEAMSLTVTGSVTFNPTSVVAVNSTIEGCGCRYDAGNILDDSSSTETIGDLSGSGGGTRILTAEITDSDSNRWTIEFTELLDSEGTVTSSSYTKIIKGSTDMTESGESIVPNIFKDNISNIKASIVAVQLDFEGSDFNISSITYDGTRVSLTIPPQEITDVEFDVTFGTHYSSLYINESPYPAS